MSITLVNSTTSGKWRTLCPICGEAIDTFSAPITAYESKCEDCNRWYYLSDAVCEPVTDRNSSGELRRAVADIHERMADDIDVVLGGPYTERENSIENPAKSRLKETAKMANIGLYHD